MSMENHTPSSTVKSGPASSLSPPSLTAVKGTNNSSVPITQDLSSSMDSEALDTYEFLGFSTNEEDCFVDNALMGMFEDAPHIEPIGSQENSQKEHRDYCDTQQKGKNNSSVPITQDLPSSMNSEALDPYEFLGFSTNEEDCFADNALMDMFKDAPLIEPIGSQENSQTEHQDYCDTQQSGMVCNAPISQDLPSSVNSEARVANELGSPYSQIDFSSSANEEYDYFVDNAPLIEQIRSQENYQKERQDYCDTHQVAINNNGSVESEHLIPEADSVIINAQTTQTFENGKCSQGHSWPTPPEIFDHLPNPTYERFIFKDPIVIQPRRSKEHSQKEDRVYSVVRQVMINSDGVKSEQFKSEPYSTNAKITGHSQVNIRLSCPANKRKKTSSVNQGKNFWGVNNTPDYRNTLARNNIMNMAFAPNNNASSYFHFNVNQGTPSFVKPTTRGCKCKKSTCSNGRCPCFQAKVGCSSKTCGCQGCENIHGINRQIPNNLQIITFDELPPQPTDSLQSRPSPCTSVNPTMIDSVNELPLPTPLQFRPSPFSLVNLPPRASVRELPQQTPPLQFRPSPCSLFNPTQRASVHELPQQTPLQFSPYQYDTPKHCQVSNVLAKKIGTAESWRGFKQ